MERQPLHIKINMQNAIEARRNILLSEKNMINFIKKYHIYMSYRKQELRQKEELRAKLKQLIIELNILLKELPLYQEGKTSRNLQEEIKDFKEDKGETKTKRYLEFELREIKRKLEDLEKMS